MGDLLLPPRVRAEIAKEKWIEQRAEQRVILERLLDFSDPVCREWGPVLKKLDPYLRLGRARPQAYEPGMNVRPGFYHYVRDNPDAPATVQPITGPDGVSFAEPDSGLLRQLQSQDLQNPAVMAALIDRRQMLEAEREREQQALLDEVNEDVMDRYKAATRAQVSMTDVPWSQNASPAARRDARNRRKP